MYYIFCPFAVGGVLQSPLFPKGTFLWIVLVAEYACVFPVERSAGHTAPFLGTVCVCPGERWRVPNEPLWCSQRNGLSVPTFETLPNFFRKTCLSEPLALSPCHKTEGFRFWVPHCALPLLQEIWYNRKLYWNVY